MSYSNDLDVADRVKTTDHRSVNREVNRIFLSLYPRSTTALLDTAFADTDRLYRGLFAGYLACNTPYHDIQHALEVTLAMARLVDGYEHSRANSPSLGSELFELGIIAALFHDAGYICREDEGHRNGAEFTLLHVSRSAEFVRQYLPGCGLAHLADIGAELIHFTDEQRPVEDLPVSDAQHRLLGKMLGSADLIAQISDRCYLEKCRDRLFPEFVTAGITQKRNSDGSLEVVYSSAQELLEKTPGFCEAASRRLREDLDACYRYAAQHFGGPNLYMQNIEKNVHFAKNLRVASALKRTPPDTLADLNMYAGMET